MLFISLLLFCSLLYFWLFMTIQLLYGILEVQIQRDFGFVFLFNHSFSPGLYFGVSGVAPGLIKKRTYFHS